jgi:hypothetical protein
MDRFADQMSSDAEASARAAEELAATLSTESARLAALHVEGAALARAHARLASAAHALGDAVTLLHDAIVHGDTRSVARSLVAAGQEWQAATSGVRAICPEAGSRKPD